MMGDRLETQESLFYQFRLDDQFPPPIICCVPSQNLRKLVKLIVPAMPERLAAA